MNTLAVVLEKPLHLSLCELDLAAAGDDDVVVEIEWSGISTGTEKLLWSGRMPSFPGMGYPLVPGYESVGRISAAGRGSGRRVGDRVFVPGARCFGDVRGLFGGAASRVVVPGARALPVEEHLGERAILLALAATAYHAARGAPATPELIVGHGVLGRLLARLAVMAGGTPVVWERDPQRAAGGAGYAVIDPAADERRNYRSIFDVSGDASLLDMLIGRLGPTGKKVCLVIGYALMLGVCWLLFRGALEQTKINWDVSAPSSGASMAWFYAVGLVFSVSSAAILLNDLFKLLAGRVADADLILVKESEDQLEDKRKGEA